MYFSIDKYAPYDIELNIRNVKIKARNTVRFLGITVDRKLLFKDHIEYVQQKCLKTMNILKFLGSNGGVLMQKPRLYFIKA